jgi:hypothetical protein
MIVFFLHPWPPAGKRPPMNMPANSRRLESDRGESCDMRPGPLLTRADWRLPALPPLHILPVAGPPIPEEHRLPLLERHLMAANKAMDGVL